MKQTLHWPQSWIAVAATVVALSHTASAQQPVGRPVPKPAEPPAAPGVFNPGAPGNTTVMGTRDRDRLQDKHGNDHDSFHDGPGGSDGVFDWVDAGDGDGLDNVWVGPEDSVWADDGDMIFVLPRNGGEPLWSGTFAEYKRIRAVVRWVRDHLSNVFEEAGGDAQPPGFWSDAVLWVSGELSLVDADFGGDGGTLPFSEILTLGPYVLGDLPPSPADLLGWMPYDEDPLVATAELELDAEQLASAVVGAQAVLAYMYVQTLED